MLGEVEKQLQDLQPANKKIQQMASSLKEKTAKLKSSLVFLGGDGYVNEGSRLREEMGNLYFEISSFPGTPSESQVNEAARIRKQLAAEMLRFDMILQEDIAAINQKLGPEEQISWTTKAAFLAAETTGIDAGSQKQHRNAAALWKQTIQQPLGVNWLKTLLH